jgi:hypothetical protein
MILIPIAATVAAVLGIVVARSSAQGRSEGFSPPGPPVSPEIERGIREALEEREGADAPPAAPSIPILELCEDGTFADFETGETYADAKALLERIAPEGAPRTKIVLRRATERVSEEALETAAQNLRERCDVHKDPQPPQK